MRDGVAEAFVVACLRLQHGLAIHILLGRVAVPVVDAAALGAAEHRPELLLRRADGGVKAATGHEVLQLRVVRLEYREHEVEADGGVTHHCVAPTRFTIASILEF